MPYVHTCMFYNLQTNIVFGPAGIQCSVFTVSGISQDNKTSNDKVQKCFFWQKQRLVWVPYVASGCLQIYIISSYGVQVLF